MTEFRISFHLKIASYSSAFIEIGPNHWSTPGSLSYMLTLDVKSQRILFRLLLDIDLCYRNLLGWTSAQSTSPHLNYVIAQMLKVPTSVKIMYDDWEKLHHRLCNDIADETQKYEYANKNKICCYCQEISFLFGYCVFKNQDTLLNYRFLYTNVLMWASF